MHEMKNVLFFTFHTQLAESNKIVNQKIFGLENCVLYVIELDSHMIMPIDDRARVERRKIEK